ncbi:hypothetical protein Pcinc_039148 [Petrolisthes cinctipes]|uniref:Uncharacterized protein n=1 Tax=Petrolisthes cinctipes TaxID=88211 RepID=A0AAE1EKW4_PETCI|nr:hypothetical protein Pcinc_039148 [Petrolisthes cinctipes]
MRSENKQQGKSDGVKSWENSLPPIHDTNVILCVDRLWATLLVVLVACLTWHSAGAFSFSRLFPASRRGVRGTLLSTLTSHKPSNSALKNAVKQAAAIKQQQQQLKHNIIKQQQEAVKQAVSKHQQQQQQQTTVTLDSVKVATTTTSTTTAKPPPAVPFTNSPIYYIRLPPSPYVYMPGLGYVSPNTNALDFLRPNVPFLNNGKPSSVYHFKSPIQHITTTTSPPSTTTTTTTTTTTPTPPTTTTTAMEIQKPGPTKKPSPITWLPGSWLFNGRPSNLFIFRSPFVPAHLDKHRQAFAKPGTYLK